MDYNIYMDESGNTGEPRIKNAKWNWGNQPYFALGSVCVKSSDADEVRNEVLKVLQTYDPKLGKDNEWKSKANNIFNVELLEDIDKILKKYNGKIFIDIANKKYKVICYFVEYCIYPYYIEDNFLKRLDNINLANSLYYNMEDSWIKRFDKICHSDIEDDDIYNLFISLLKDLKDSSSVEVEKESIEKVIYYVSNYKEFHLKRKNLLPIVDNTNKGNPTCFLPNIDAFNNIISSTSVFKLKKNDVLHIYHDEQKQFDQAIRNWVENMKTNNKLPVDDIKFISSSNDIMIQLADFLVGRVLRIFQSIIDCKNLKRKDRDMIKIMKKMIAGNCNVVSIRSEQERFFKEFGLKTINSPIPFYFK